MGEQHKNIEASREVKCDSDLDLQYETSTLHCLYTYMIHRYSHFEFVENKYSVPTAKINGALFW